VLPNTMESAIEPQTAQFYQPFSSSPLILPGEYTFKIYASVPGADPSAIATRKLTIAQNEPTPTPILPVGEATEVTFSPSDTVYFSQSKELTINWENPRWPQGAQFTYDVELTHRLGYTIFKQENITTRSVRLFPEGWTTADPGAFYVSIQAHVAGLGSGYPTVHTVWLVGDPVVIPTPTPIPANPDISRDDTTDFTDLMLFALSYRTIDGNQGFERFADFATDGVINSKDLLQFMALYAKRGDAKPQAPLWLYVEAPQFELVQAGDATICNPVGQIQIDFPPNEIPQNESCVFAFMYMATFYFSPVPGAVDYIVTVDSDRISQEMSVKPTFQTAGATMFNIQFSLFKEWVSLQVEAMFEDGTTSDKSDLLRIYAVE
jgi:hypothetical protein